MSVRASLPILCVSSRWDILLCVGRGSLSHLVCVTLNCHDLKNNDSLNWCVFFTLCVLLSKCVFVSDSQLKKKAIFFSGMELVSLRFNRNFTSAWPRGFR